MRSEVSNAGVKDSVHFEDEHSQVEAATLRQNKSKQVLWVFVREKEMMDPVISHSF